MRAKALLCIFIVHLVSNLPLTQAVQEVESTSVVQTALELVNQNCNQMRRNQACYGHDLLVAEARPGANPFVFVTEGDIEDLSKIQSLRLSGLDDNAGTWGIALMQLRANLPASQPENVVLLAFGNVQLENAVMPPTQAEVQVQTRQHLNVRQLPTTNASVVGALVPGQMVTVVERLIDSSWLRVILPDDEQTGWVRADLVSRTTDLESLNVAAGNTSYFHEPMQAFYFSSSRNDSLSFSQIPNNGLIIQTPEGVGEVHLLINEINIQLGSTVFFQAQPGSYMTVSTLEGHADVRAFGIEQTAFAGTQVVIPLSESLRPNGPPSPPQPYDKAQLESLPIRVLPRPISIAESMTFIEIQEQLDQNSSDPTQMPRSENAPEAVCCGATIDVSRNNCPGNSCNAPGQGGSCPGNSCNAPGQNKEKDKKDK